MNNEELNEMAKKAKEELANQTKGTNRFDYSAIMNNTRTAPEENYTLSQTEGNAHEDNVNMDDEIPQSIFEENPKLKQFDEELFPGGPTSTELDLMKKEWEGYDIYIIELLNKYTFIFRTLSRFEYKQLVALQNVDALQREEIICEAAVLWPKQFNATVMAPEKAGIPSTLSEIIMDKSGFTKDFAVQEI